MKLNDLHVKLDEASAKADDGWGSMSIDYLTLGEGAQLRFNNIANIEIDTDYKREFQRAIWSISDSYKDETPELKELSKQLYGLAYGSFVEKDGEFLEQKVLELMMTAHQLAKSLLIEQSMWEKETMKTIIEELNSAKGNTERLMALVSKYKTEAS